MKECFFLLYFLLSIQFIHGETTNCREYNDYSNNQHHFVVDHSPSGMPVPEITEIDDESILFEENDSIQMDETSAHKNKPMALWFFSVGDAAKIVVKKPPGYIHSCKVNRCDKKATHVCQTFHWWPKKTCSFTIDNFLNDYFGTWDMEVEYESQNEIVSIQNKKLYLIDADENKDSVTIIEDNSFQISNRTIFGAKIKMKRFVTDRGITIKPSIPPAGTHITQSVKKCQAIHHVFLENKTYSIVSPKISNDPKNPLIYTGNYYSCEFKISALVEKKYFGHWDVITYFNDSTNFKNGLTKQIDTVEIHEIERPDDKSSTPTVPQNNFYVSKGSYVSINYLNEKYPEEKINNCHLIDKRTGKQYNLHVLIADDRDIKLIGKCGVRMRVLKNNYPDRIDYWSLEGTSINNSQIYDFAITVTETKHQAAFTKKNIPSTEGLNNLTVGNDDDMISYAFENGEICPADILDCELEFPNGTFVSIIQSNCTYTFDGITRSDSGPLKLSYSLKKRVRVKEYLYDIHFQELNNIMITEYPEKKNDYIDLSVDVYSREIKAKSCQLKSLKNSSISLELFDKQIKRYEQSYVQKDLVDYHRCEFKVPASSSLEPGVWKFLIIYDNGHNKSRNLIINRHIEEIETRNFTESNSSFVGNETFVMFGKKFVVNCSQNVPLDFCRFTNPIGVIYPMTNETLLQFGKCEMTVEFADYNHGGTWSCRLGTEKNISTGSTTFLFQFKVSILRSKF